MPIIGPIMESRSSNREIEIAFIVGLPRAATRWLCKCLNEHPDAAAFGEMRFWGRWYVKPSPDGRYAPEQLRRVLDLMRPGICVNRYSDDQPGSLRHVREATFSELLDRAFPDLNERLTPAEVFRRVLHEIGRTEGVSLVLEKTPHHLNWIERIVTAIPEARFVIMVRDPYSFMLSYKHQGDRKSERVQRSYQQRYHPLLGAVVWRSSMISAMAARQRLPQQTHTISQEDLKENPEVVLTELQKFLGLDVHPLAGRVPVVNSSFPDGKRPELSAADIFWMNRVAGRMIRKSGYPMRRTPFRPWEILWSILVLPVWAVRNLLSMRRIVEGSVIAYCWRWLRPKRRSASVKANHAPVVDAE